MIFQAFCVSAKGWYDKKNFVISENGRQYFFIVPNVYFIAYEKQKSIAEKLSLNLTGHTTVPTTHNLLTPPMHSTTKIRATFWSQSRDYKSY